MKKPTPFTEVGAFGLAQYGGFVRDEFLYPLQGDKALAVYREMYDNDPIVGAVVFAIQMLIRKVEWRVEPAEASTVEAIVAERMAERQQATNEQKQAQQQRLMQQQAGLAGNSPGGPHAGGPGAPPAAPMHRSPLASGLQGAPTALHQPLGGSPVPGTTPPGQPGPAAPGAVTPPGLPGTNPPHEVHALGTNSPDITGVPDVQGTDPLKNPGSNPGGGPAQEAALAGNFGTGGGMKPGSKTNGKKADAAAEQIAASVGPPPPGFWDRMMSPFRKAAGGSSGASVPGIEASDPENSPIDEETGLPMEFPIGAGPTDITPEAQKAEELAVFVETCFHDMANSWADILGQIITMIVWGWSFHEIVYKKRNGPNPDFPEQGSKFSDGRIGWSNFAGRAQETRHRWEFDDTGHIMGMWQLAPPKFQLRYIPMQKGLLFRTTAYKNNPEGRSCFRSAYRPWFFKKRIEEYEAVGVERDLAGLPVAYVPYQLMTASATLEEQAALTEIKKIVRNLRRNEQEGVVFPNAFDPDTNQKLYELTLLASPSRRQFDTNVIIQRYAQQIAMTALADVILIGHESVGARSLGETKVDLFTAALEAFLDVICDEINTAAIPRLMQINGEDPAMCPVLTHGSLDTIELSDVAAMVTAMSGAGADLFPDTQLEDFLREEAGMPPKAASQDL
jgi:hypothetical protein